MMRRWTIGRVLGLAAGVALLLALVLSDTPPAASGAGGARPALAAGVTALMAAWWLSEALPIHWTACVPLLLFPLLGVLPGGPAANLRGAAQAYANPYIFLFLGGMCIAAAMQQWSLHRRLALYVMRAVGTEPRRLLWGVLLATAGTSMWISNTATATMMMPIALALVRQLEHRLAGARLTHFGAALMLGVAYASNVGGLGTKIGTAPNAMLSGFLAQRGVEVSFLEFAAVGSGFAVLFLPLVALVLWRIGRRDAPRADVGRAVLDQELAALGPLRAGERVVLAVFLAAAALWILGRPLLGLVRPPVLAATGLALGAAHVEAGVALLAALCLAVWRAEGRAVLELRSLRLVSWPALLLLGGGFAMAEGVQQSGLSGWMAGLLAAGAGLPALAQLLLASSTTVALSAVASNTATIAVMLNVLAEAAAPEHATSVLFAATLACSCDFALPAGTPPNAIVFGSGYVTVRRMAGAGIVLDLAAAVLVALWCRLAVGLFV